jgi:hypothetical protein
MVLCGELLPDVGDGVTVSREDCACACARPTLVDCAAALEVIGRRWLDES